MTEKNKFKIVDQICENYSTGKFSIESCCKNAGITYKTFTNWINENSAFSESYKKAKERKREEYKSELVELSLTALKKKLSFSKYKEIRIETGEDGKITKKIETERIMIPGATDIAIVLNLFLKEMEDPKQITEINFL